MKQTKGRRTVGNGKNGFDRIVSSLLSSELLFLSINGFCSSNCGVCFKNKFNKMKIFLFKLNLPKHWDQIDDDYSVLMDVHFLSQLMVLVHQLIRYFVVVIVHLMVHDDP